MEVSRWPGPGGKASIRSFANVAYREIRSTRSVTMVNPFLRKAANDKESVGEFFNPIAASQVEGME